MKLEASMAAFSPCIDRFAPEGYKDGYSFEKILEIISKIDGIGAIPLITDESTPDPVKMKKLLADHGLVAGTVCPNNYSDRIWRNGSLANRDKDIRKKIIRIVQDSMDYCEVCGGEDVMLWLAQDGYDYPFEDDYATRWEYIRESLYEIASYRKDVRLTIEYKINEPRTHQYISDISKALLMCSDVGLPNLGVIIDLGHALFGGENPSESVAMAQRYGRLFHIHLNDNYRRADDDLIIGTVHLWETLEFFYRLQEARYDGWYVMDIWPGRMDGAEASREFAQRANALYCLAECLPRDTIQAYQRDNNVPGLLKLLREYTLKN